MTMEIKLLRADVASLKVDAIVTPADPKTVDAEGHDGVAVTGGNLLARFVIQVRVPQGTEEGAAAMLEAATVAALDRAEELAVASIGLPAIGTGPFAFTPEQCARAMLPAALAHRSRARSLQRAVFCLFGKEEYVAFERVLGELEP
jgi:O-acetyl-ADP-ribose deacetylase (regulator of RNase III)